MQKTSRIYFKYLPDMLLRIGTASSAETSYHCTTHASTWREEPLAPAAQLMAGVIKSHLKAEAVKAAAAA